MKSGRQLHWDADSFDATGTDWPRRRCVTLSAVVAGALKNPSLEFKSVVDTLLAVAGATAAKMLVDPASLLQHRFGALILP